MENILALDLGTKCGWCVYSENKLIAHGMYNFEKNRSLGARFADYEDFLCNTIEKYHINSIMYENVLNHIGVYASHVYGGFLAILFKISHKYQLNLKGLCVTTIKKIVTGSGRASKQEMIAAVNKKCNLFVQDDNEADAIGVLLAGLAK